MLTSLFKAISAALTPPYKSLSAQDAKGPVDSGSVFLIDVRTKEEFSHGKIKGARNIPLGDLARRISELDKQKNAPILINCHSGARSASACRYLVSVGFTDVTNLNGGISAWLGAGFKTA